MYLLINVFAFIYYILRLSLKSKKEKNYIYLFLGMKKAIYLQSKILLTVDGVIINNINININKMTKADIVNEIAKDRCR